MKIATFPLSIAFLLLACFGLESGKYNRVLSIGDAAPAWKDLPGTDGKKHSLADLKDKPIVVVVFTCNSCPYATDYEDRLIALAKSHADAKSAVAVVAINVNLVEEDRLPAMEAKAKEKKFNFTYLFDESQQIARDYGAIYTPEFYVLDKDRKIVFMGAMDDANDPAKVKVSYVEEAIRASMAGKKAEVGEAPSRGCAVRYAKKKRTAEEE